MFLGNLWHFFVLLIGRVAVSQDTTVFQIELWEMNDKNATKTKKVKEDFICSGKRRSVPNGALQYALDFRDESMHQAKVAVWIRGVSIGHKTEKLYVCLPVREFNQEKEASVSEIGPQMRTTEFHVNLTLLNSTNAIFSGSMSLNCLEETEIEPDELNQSILSDDPNTTKLAFSMNTKSLISMPPDHIQEKNGLFTCSSNGERIMGVKTESDLNLENYIIESSEFFRKQMVQGFPNLKIPPLAPYRLLDYHLYKPYLNSMCFQSWLPVLTVFGLQNYILTSVSSKHNCVAELPITTFDLAVRIPVLHVHGIHIIEGFIMHEEFESVGHGTIDIRLKELDINVSFVTFPEKENLQIASCKILLKWANFSCELLGFVGIGFNTAYFSSLLHRFEPYAVYALPMLLEELELFLTSKINSVLSFSFFRIFEKIMHVMRKQLKSNVI